jgi:hypothetical protein
MGSISFLLRVVRSDPATKAGLGGFQPETGASRMDPSPTYVPNPLSDGQMEKLRRRVCAVADQLSDAQILMLADSLHETLRSRRRLRARVGQRLEETRQPSGVHIL